jgi:hypothetical protein
MEHVDKIRSPEYLRVFPDADALYPDTDLRTAVLAELYRQTLPPDLKATRERKKQNKSTLRMLESLATEAESFIAVLGRIGTWIETEDERWPVDLSPVLEKCEALALSSRYYLGVVRRPYTREPNLVRRCVPLFVFLTKDLKITTRQALGFLRIALRAHGYDETALGPFQSPRQGTVRKSLAAWIEKIHADFKDRRERTGRYSQPAQPSNPAPNIPPVSPKTQKA